MAIIQYKQTSYNKYKRFKELITRGYKWCNNKQEFDMRQQAWHDYINQYYNYKKFVSFGIIYKFDKYNYICIGLFKESEKAYLMLFSNDSKNRQNHVIQQVLNIINNMDSEK